MSKRGVISIFLMFFIIHITINTESAASNQKIKVAMLNLKANNTSTANANIVRDIFEVHLYKTDTFKIIERNQIDLILKEYGLEMSGCVETECAVKIGKILSVDMVIVGSLNKLNKFSITIKFINIKKGQLVYADFETAVNEDGIEEAVNILANRVAKKMSLNYVDSEEETEEDITDAHEASENQDAKRIISDQEDKVSIVEKSGDEIALFSSTGYYLRGTLPGWGQLYSGRNLKSAIFFSSFILSVAALGYFTYDFRNKRADYEKLPESVSPEKNKAVYDESDRAFMKANVALGVFVCVYLLNWVDIFFFSMPDSNDNLNNMTSKDYNNLSFEFYNTFIPESGYGFKAAYTFNF